MSTTVQWTPIQHCQFLDWASVPHREAEPANPSSHRRRRVGHTCFPVLEGDSGKGVQDCIAYCQTVGSNNCDAVNVVPLVNAAGVAFPSRVNIPWVDDASGHTSNCVRDLLTAPPPPCFEAETDKNKIKKVGNCGYLSAPAGGLQQCQEWCKNQTGCYGIYHWGNQCSYIPGANCNYSSTHSSGNGWSGTGGQKVQSRSCFAPVLDPKHMHICYPLKMNEDRGRGNPPW